MNVDQLFEEFVNRKPENKGASRGRKQCPNCSSYVGVRLQLCDCGHEFVKGENKQEVESEITEEDMLYAQSIGAPGGRIVYAGSGTPSARLSDISNETVNDYCNFVVHEGIQKGLIYTVRAIKKYLQHQFGYDSDEYRKACDCVDRWYNRKIGIDTPSGEEYND